MADRRPSVFTEDLHARQSAQGVWAGGEVREEAALTLLTRLPVPPTYMSAAVTCSADGLTGSSPPQAVSQIGSVVAWLPLSYGHLCLRETKHHEGQPGFSSPSRLWGESLGPCSAHTA